MRGFLQSVANGEIRFGTDDKLKVILRIIQEVADEKLKISRDIVRVIRHLPKAEQTKLEL